jgi:hypothetical protein
MSLWYENEKGEVVAKRCSKCPKIKLIEEYHKHSEGVGGRNSCCKSCKSTNSRNYRQNNREKIVELERKYREENRVKFLEKNRNYYENNREKYAENNRNYRKNNLDKRRIYELRRRARINGLPDTLAAEQYEKTLQYFNYTCALTGQTVNLEREHAIPIAVGHGGTTFENMYPMVNGLNQSKNDSNIFEWFEANRQRFELSQERFDRLIGWLASANAMTVEEYRDYVYWCHANPRTVDEVNETNEGGTAS